MPDFSMNGGSGMATRRAVSQHSSQQSRNLALKPDVDPAPKPWPFAPALAVLFVLFFISLQFMLPATHYRHPGDPYRNWIPIIKDGNEAKPSDKLMENSESPSAAHGMQVGDDFKNFPEETETHKPAHIFVWTEEKDVRPLAVVINSTISNAKNSSDIYFHFIVPAGSAFEIPLFHFKEWFSEASFEFVRDAAFAEKLNGVMTFGRDKRDAKEILSTLDLFPFYIPKMYPDAKRFVYLDSDVVLQGNVKELLQVDMQGHAVAAVEDCSQHFDAYFDFKVLEAAQESKEVGKPWMPVQPYDPETCAFDRGVLVVDAERWTEKNLTEAIEWWIKESEKTDHGLYRYGLLEPPVLLALYQNYQKLDESWNVREPLLFKKSNTAKLLHFDKKNKPWHSARPAHSRKDVAGLWWAYLSPVAGQLLNSD